MGVYVISANQSLVSQTLIIQQLVAYYLCWYRIDVCQGHGCHDYTMNDIVL